MQKKLLMIAVALASLSISAQDSVPDSTEVKQIYLNKLDSLAVAFAEETGTDLEDISDNPLYFRLFMPLVLYGSVVSDALTPYDVQETDTTLLPVTDFTKDSDGQLTQTINESLMRIYMEHPELIKMTEDELLSVKTPTTITQDVAAGINLSINGTPTVVQEPDAPEFIKNKPICWSTSGNFQGKFTQSAFSDNWYKGGVDNLTFLAQLVLEANYVKKNTTFDNKLEMKLGYYSAEENDKRVLKTNEDLLRFTSKYGLKAFNYWYYSAQLQAYTQFLPVYNNNNGVDHLKSKFFAPMYGSLSVGMDYKPKFKNNNLSLSVLLSPITYNMRYVSVDSIATNYGIEQGKNYMYTLGSKIDINGSWKPFKDFKWTYKAQYYTSYESAEVNVENTLDYMFSKYFSLQFFLHYRFDDSVKRKPDMTYHQFKEFFTLNFNYSW